MQKNTKIAWEDIYFVFNLDIFINDVIFLDPFCLQKLLDILAFQKLKEILELLILSIFIWRFANVSTIFQK